ncbi:MAG: type II toxin-antitoxin system VapC family toxin [bacterium]|nr:type II toxin-antitoxin system VapC family toxin [bacterium]
MIRIAFDTSVLVAALVEPHPRHARAFPWLEAAEDGRVEGECTVHALAETWSVLTRLPIDPSIAPPMATAAVERLAAFLEPVELSSDIYWKAMRRCSEHGLRSGVLFDALHLACAESSNVDAFITFNPGDFERLAVTESPAIVVPPDPPAFGLPKSVRLNGRS